MSGMNTALADRIGMLLATIIEFFMNLTPGYLIMVIMLFVGAVVILYFRFFAKLGEKVLI